MNGAARDCLSRDIEISDGRIEGSTITFQCKSLDGDRTTAFTGRINGDTIAFEWDLRVREGGNGPDPNNGMFGASAPHRFTAKRVVGSTDADLAEIADTSARIHKYPAVSFDRILHASQEPQNWLTYSGTVSGQRYSPLTQITPANVKNLELAWIWQAQSQARFEATSLVVDGVLYTVQAPNDVVALDAVTGRVLWTYTYAPAPRARASGGGGQPNRGLAILGETLFIGTLDAHLLAINAGTGKLVWNTTVADVTDPACQGHLCYVITHAPLVVKDKVIVGVGGGEGPIRGFIAAFDVTTGKEVWRFYTIPAAGEPGSETWSGDSWKTGGAGVWNTGAYDPDLNLTYWGTGNPYPPWDGKTRPGDNLYTDSVVALDADTGKLKWQYQFTPHDVMDWDATEIPVLADIQWQGRPRKVMLWANRNGLMYVLDRSTGQFLMGKPFVEVNWMTGFDEKGRPTQVPGQLDDPEKTNIVPWLAATNWYPPSYSPNTGLFYIPSWERGSMQRRPSPSYGAIRAFDPETGEKKWEFKRNDAIFTAGALTTASDLLFTGVGGDYYSGDAAARLVNGYFYALDARTGQLLWQMSLAGSVQSGPMSYSVGGKQYIAVTAGNTLFAFALRQ
ncbi:MAG TPA: PQQ-binding-like beta-propeller repeat protein [Bryobacteraceae bacterium]|nr:PQQ-binding-like beta-propeller repeat protein [Bryobacteraceae bacterium]